MKKIVLLSERLPFPPTSGTKNLLYNYCRIFHDNLGMSVVNISFTESDDDVSLKPKFIDKVYELPNPSGAAKIKNLIVETFVKHKFPMQVSLFWDASIKRKIDEIVKSEKPDYVIADLVRTAEYLKDFEGLKILDMQDLFSLRYERQLAVDIDSVNPYGSYLFRFPKLVQKMLDTNIIKKAVMGFEIRLLKKYEIEAGRIYDRVMFVARKEAEYYDRALGKRRALVAPLGVDIEYFSSSWDITKKPMSIAFMGALSVAHNENGIIHFVKCILPMISEKKLGAKLYVIGGGAGSKVKALESENVILTGRVDDVRVAIRSCDVFVCPLQFGSGIKTKNLEAMAMGIPVVTTTIGAENIDAENGRDWYVAEDDQEFADCVCALLKDSELRERIGRNGQEFVKKYFTWANAEAAFRKALNMENERIVKTVGGYYIE